jgi:2',3'-cyclic-nucleotide 2'-phosphodiesterase/3'-nucleotidase
MLLDNGDFLQGNPMGDYMAYERGMSEGDVHPMIAAMNTLGFDASTLGNHEFNYGLPFLMNSVAGAAAFPVVCANVATEMGGSATGGHDAGSALRDARPELTDGAGESHPIRIGIIGFVPPQIMTWDRRHLEGNVQARDIVAAAQAWVPQMREEGAEIIIALSHSGIGVGRSHRHDGKRLRPAGGGRRDRRGPDRAPPPRLPRPDYADFAGVDAEAGHDHGKPAVMAGFWGSHMGLVDLMLERDGNSWRIASHMSRRGRSTGAERGPLDHRAGGERRGGSGLGRGRARGDAGLCPRRGGQDGCAAAFLLRAGGGRPVGPDRVERADLVHRADDGGHRDTRACRSCRPPRRSRRAAAAGRNTTPTCPRDPSRSRTWPTSTSTPTRCARCASPGRRCANGWNGRRACSTRSRPGEADQVLLNPDFPSYNFDVIDGVTYQIDLSQPSRYNNDGEVVNPDAHRIVNLMFEGAAIDPRRNSSSPPTTTARAAAATSPAPTRRR